MDVFLMVEIKIVPFYPALMIQGEQKSLVVTDLHLGFEDNLSLNNISVGKNTTTRETIKEIEKILDMTQPDSIILLGDIKSGIKSITKSEWKDVPLFFEKINEKVNVILVPGNHDASIQQLIPKEITLGSSKGIIVDDSTFNAWTYYAFREFFSCKQNRNGTCSSSFFPGKIPY